MSEKIFRFKHNAAVKSGISRHKNTVNGSFLLHTHDYYEFEIAISGRGKNYINGAEHHVSRGSIWALGPDDTHSLDGDALTVFNVSLYLPEIPRDLSEKINSFEFPLCGNAGDSTAIIEALFSVFFDYNNDESYAEKAATIAKLIILEFASNLTHAEAVGGKTSEYVRRAVRIIHDRANEEITLTNLASELHVAPAYLSAIFPQHAGCGFNEYLTRTRLGRAKAMLKQTNKTVTEIAGACGFGCVSAMNRAFRKYFDSSPSEERKEKG